MKITSKEVSFEISGQKQIGTLFLGKRDFLHLETNQPFFQSATIPFEIHCISAKQHFTLIDSVTRSGNIYPLYVIEDFLQKDCHSFEFYLDGVYEWLSRDIYNKNLFKENILINNFYCICKGVLKKKKLSITIESIDNPIATNQIKSIIDKFIQLFCLLCYKGIACNEVYIIENNKRHKIYSWFFSTYQNKKPFYQTFLSPGLIENADNLWSVILHNYFERKKDLFEHCLNQFIGQIDYKGYWDYEIFGLYAIVDRFTKIKKIGQKKSVFSASKINGIYSTLENIFNSQRNLNDEEKLIWQNILNKTNNMKKWNFDNDKARFKLLLSESLFFNDDETKLFEHLESKIDLLDKIRNMVGHGDYSEFHELHYSNLQQAVCQLKILISNLIYKELGIPLGVILKSLRHSMHNDFYSAKLDECLLNRMIGDVPIFKVSKESFDSFSSPQYYTCFLYDSNKQCLNREIHIEKQMNKISNERKTKSLTEAVALISPDFSEATYLNTIIIECQENPKLIRGVIIANYEKIPKEVRKICEKQIWPPKKI